MRISGSLCLQPEEQAWWHCLLSSLESRGGDLTGGSFPACRHVSVTLQLNNAMWLCSPWDQLSASGTDPAAPSLSEHPADTAQPRAKLPREKYCPVSPIWNETQAGSSQAGAPATLRVLVCDKGSEWVNWLRTGHPWEALEEAWTSQGGCHGRVRLGPGEGYGEARMCSCASKGPGLGSACKCGCKSHLLSSSHRKKYFSLWHVANILSWHWLASLPWSNEYL